jgi:23S rRNA (uridine2552-2'-O)-methyltransferase
MPKIFQNLKHAKKFSKSSKKWLLRQINDEYYHKAKTEGWRSRATYKIIEIDDKYKIFSKNKIVIDLGCAPGGWSQYCVDKVGHGNVIALDLLKIEPINGVNFIQLDFFQNNASLIIKENLQKINAQSKCDIILSDMASNTTGDKKTDHIRIINLAEEALKLSMEILRENGCFITKIFQGGSSDEILKQLRDKFSKVNYFKPKSSRKDSAETYLIARGFKINSN